jgi:Tol biopolymer transport system component
MKKIILILIWCLGTLIMVTGQEQQAEKLLSKAIYEEEVNGELDEAIKTYQLIVKQYPDNRKVAAEALLHLGMCYEKQGNQEAKNAYRQVIQKYADQNDLVAEARDRLAALELPIAPAPTKGLSVRKIWEGSEVDLMGEPSPDGKYISVVDWDSGDLAIYEIATEKKRRLTNMGSWDDPNEFAMFSRWSPDGKQIVFDWYNEDNPALIDLYTIGLDGSEPRLLFSDEKFSWTQCYDWSPDGKQVLACFSIKEDSSNLIGLVSTADGSVRMIKELGKKSWPENMRISPDGRFIAYDLPPDEDSRARDIYLLTTDGSSETPLVEHPSNDILLGWSPGGGSILFGSERNGTLGSWSIQVIEGKPQGEPKLVKPVMGPIVPFGFTDQGSYYYGIHERMHNIYIAELNTETGKIVAPVEKAIRRFEGYNQTPSYSPDGKYLAYISKRSPLLTPLGLRLGGNVLCIKSLETGKEREFHPELDLIGFPTWSPDGSSIVLVHWNYNEGIELCQMDAKKGDVTMVSRPGDNYSHFGYHQWSPTGDTFYYGLRDRNADSWRIMARDIESGKEDTIYRSGDFYTISISPDGEWFVLTCPSNEDAHIKIVSADGKESRELYRFEEGTEIGRVPSTTWTRDGKYILFGMYNPETDDKGFELCRIKAEDGELEKTGLKMESPYVNLSAHPDGKHFTFSSSERVVEVWMMENFLPEIKDEQ